MIKKKLIKNAKKVDQFLIKYLKNQKKSLLIKPMKYGVISGGKKIILFSQRVLTRPSIRTQKRKFFQRNWAARMRRN